MRWVFWKPSICPPLETDVRRSKAVVKTEEFVWVEVFYEHLVCRQGLHFVKNMGSAIHWKGSWLFVYRQERHSPGKLVELLWVGVLSSKICLVINMIRCWGEVIYEWKMEKNEKIKADGIDLTVLIWPLDWTWKQWSVMMKRTSGR
jgi:hypothetical protein